ncbi:MAG: hypothetical protein ACFE0I_23345 [Elainellaceae cyanobacterium]
MLSQKIDAVFSQEDIDAVMEAIASIRQKMPFLMGLTSDQRRQIAKIGRKSQTFTVQALTIAQNHPELMPGCLDLKEAYRDLDLFEALSSVLQTVGELHELIEDTQIIAGSEAYAAARLAYQSAKATGKNIGMENVMNDVSIRFRKRRKSSTAPN